MTKEDEVLIKLNQSIFDFIDREQKLGANKSSIELAIKNIVRDKINRMYKKK